MSHFEVAKDRLHDFLDADAVQGCTFSKTEGKVDWRTRGHCRARSIVRIWLPHKRSKKKTILPLASVQEDPLQHQQRSTCVKRLLLHILHQ
jgi:hypothetical protein